MLRYDSRMTNAASPQLEIPNDLSRLIDDLVPGIVDDLGPNILKPSLVAVDGTEHSGVVFEIDSVLLYAHLRTALRAKGFEIPNWGDVAHSYFL